VDSRRDRRVHLLARNVNNKLLSVDGGIASWQFQMIASARQTKFLVAFAVNCTQAEIVRTLASCRRSRKSRTSLRRYQDGATQAAHPMPSAAVSAVVTSGLRAVSHNDRVEDQR